MYHNTFQYISTSYSTQYCSIYTYKLGKSHYCISNVSEYQSKLNEVYSVHIHTDRQCKLPYLTMYIYVYTHQFTGRGVITNTYTHPLSLSAHIGSSDHMYLLQSPFQE